MRAKQKCERDCIAVGKLLINKPMEQKATAVMSMRADCEPVYLWNWKLPGVAASHGEGAFKGDSNLQVSSTFFGAKQLTSISVLIGITAFLVFLRISEMTSKKEKITLFDNEALSGGVSFLAGLELLAR